MTWHQMLKRQIKKSGISVDSSDSSLKYLLEMIDRAYHEFDQSVYLSERSLELSSKEMRALYDKIKNEKEKSEAQTKYIRTIFDSIPDLIFLVDKDLNIIDVNGNVSDFLGKTDAVNQKISLYLQDSKPINPLFSLTKNKKKRIKEYQTILKSHKEALHVIVAGSPIFQKGMESAEQVVLVVKDISELKNLEKENAEKQAMLMHASRLASLGEMATGVAHELNQPLSIINTNIQTMELYLNEGLLDVENKDEFNDIIQSSTKQVKRAENIINHMRKFARKNDVPEDALEAIDLSIPVNNALFMFNEQFRLHEINIIKNISTDCKAVKIAEQDFEQVVVNLLSNAKFAVHAMKNKAKSDGKTFEMQIEICLKMSADRQNIILTLADNGIGMTKDVQFHCFEPFFTTKAVGDGTGLGLAIAYTMLNNAHGLITVKSEPEHGSIFTITLPVAEGS